MDNNMEVRFMKCSICERACVIPEGKTGACGLYKNNGQEITELYPDNYLVVCPISIETMPMLHFYPGGKFLQISTAGCNFNCNGCVSTVIAKEMDPASRALRKLSPEEVVSEAIKNDCIGIAFLMNDPLASLPTFIKVAGAAKSCGLLVGCSTNAYFTETSLAQIISDLDFINVGVKGLSDQAYRGCGGSTVKPVLRNIKKLFESGIHVEISCIYQRHNEEEILSLARHIAQISKDIPLHIMRFIPLENANPLLEPSIREAEKLYQRLKKHLSYIYLFNSPGTDYLNTFCPGCGEIIYKRDFYGPMGAKLRLADTGSIKGNTCPGCGQELKSIRGTLAKTKYQEGDFQGGYPFTRALEMMEAILITMGVSDKKKVLQVWEEVLCNNMLSQLHRDLQNLQTYMQTIRYFGRVIRLENKAEELASYLEERVSLITKGLRFTSNKPRVYYAMGKPLFCIKGERFENQLVEAAGGISINKEIEGSGRPGMKISVEKLNALNPQIIFISAFISAPVEDFYVDCCAAGVDVEAVRNKRIYNYPAPGWDFGSPRWILGLMYMANILHPEIFNFDVFAEAEEFYQKFYATDFSISDLNRSFGKPSSKWMWR
ncbi:radical SAM protein [Moorella sp. Hama-1]|uniref:radical SAM protein n=1 Tax=Moorella sp. Hama-1 TaxID=2138101 RepID=UPI001914075E|nr:radical SAM protein [Moorella sp. Hama-1]